MPYDKDTPASINETFSVSQPKIAANFNAIKDLVDQDHETFGAANEGKHKQVTMPAQAAASTTTASERAIYCKNNAAAAPALWIQDAGVGAPADGIDFTTAIKAAEGFTTLPSGIMFIWGSINIPGGTQAATATFVNTGFPNAVFTIQATVTHGGNYSANDTIFSALNPTQTQCVFSRNNPYKAAPITVKYLAIGN